MRLTPTFAKILLIPGLMLLSAYSWALTEMDDSDLSQVQGAGLAFGLEDIRVAFAPTSFIELTGTPTDNSTTFQRGDARYYGLSLSGGGSNAYHSDGSSCSGSGLECPKGLAVNNYANDDNPFVLRVFDYTKPGYDGTSSTSTVLELLGPSNSDPFRWSFWGEIEVARNGTCPSGGNSNYCALQSQTLIHGKPAVLKRPASMGGTDYQGAKLKLFQFTGDQSLGLLYHSALSGDFRFTVNQLAGSADQLRVAPRFSTQSGLVFKNVQAYLPLGQMHYQAITLDDTDDDNGNFQIELTRLQNQASNYDDFYSLPGNCAGEYSGSRCGYKRDDRPPRYYETHGFVEWGNVNTVNGTGNNANGDGIYFQKGDQSPDFTAYASRPVTGQLDANNTPPPETYTSNDRTLANIGDSRITGLSIQHLKITTLSAGQ